MRLDLYNENNLDILPHLPDNSVHAVVTDPPYGLSFMGSKWDADVPSAETWAHVLRVLKPGGYLLAFFGTRTYHRGAAAIEDADFIGIEMDKQYFGWAEARIAYARAHPEAFGGKPKQDDRQKKLFD